MSEFVYIIKPEHSNVYKIGQTVDLDRSLLTLGKKFSFNLKVVHSVKVLGDSWTIENHLHMRYSQYHLGGDWFALDSLALADAISQMNKYKEEQ